MRIIKRPRRQICVVIFDIDRTLYPKKSKYFRKGQEREIYAVAERWNVTPREASRRIRERQKKIFQRNGGRKVTRTEALTDLGISHRWWVNIRKECWKPRGQLHSNDQVIAILRELSLSFRLAAASNAVRAVSVLALEALHLSNFFELVWGPDDAGSGKHRVAYWHRLAKHLEIRPRNCVVVGDRREADCDPAVRAGFGGAILVRGPSDLGEVRNYLLRKTRGKQ